MRKVVVDSKAEAHFENLTKDRQTQQYGIVIGQVTPLKEYIAHVVPTPNQQEGGIDEEWIVEHVVQVMKMLPGGLDVLGLYIYRPSGSKAVVAKIKSSLSLVCKRARHVPSDGDLLLLEAASDKKASLSCTTLRGSGIDLSIQSFQNKFHTFQMSFSFTVSIPFGEPKSHNVSSLITEGIQEKLQSQLPLVYTMGGAVVDPSTPISSLDTSKVHELVGLTGACASVNGATLKDNEVKTTGCATLTGTVVSRAIAFNSKVNMEWVQQALCGDVVASVCARVDLLNDDLDAEDEGGLGTVDNIKHGSWQLAKRTFVPLTAPLSQPAPFACDYVVAGEEENESKERCQEMLNVSLDNLKSDGANWCLMLENDAVAPPSPTTSLGKSTKPTVPPPSKQGKGTSSSADGATTTTTTAPTGGPSSLLVGAAAAVVAALVGGFALLGVGDEA